VTFLTRLISWIPIAAGAALVLFAISTPDHSYSEVLLGREGASLSWGPSLFRGLLLFHGIVLIAFGVWRKKSNSPADHTQTVNIDRPERTTPIVILALVSLSVVALILRLLNLNSDLWIDEVLTLLDFVRKPLGEIVVSFPSQNQHMLFSILARFSTNIFGENPWALRLPSVLFGVISIWAFFFMCRSLLNTGTALLGSTLLTVSYHHIWFSQNARGYMGLLLFTLLATWCWLEGIRSNERRWWVGYTASVVLGMWVHPTMAFVVAAQGVVHFLLLAVPRLSGDKDAGASPERRAGWRPFVAWLLSVTLTLQLYALALPEFLSVGLHEESKNSEWTNPLWVISESFKSLSIGFAGMAVVLLGGAFVAFGWSSLFRSNRRAAVLLVLPAILAGGTMLLLGHNIWPRFFFFSMGFGLMIVIHGAMRLPEAAGTWIGWLRVRPTLTRYAGIGACLLIIAASLATVSRNYALPKQNYSGAKNYVETHSSPSDKLVAVSLAGVVYGSYLTPYWPVAKTDSDLEPLQANQNVWLVYTLPPEIKAFHPEMWRRIETDYEIVRVFPGTLNGGEVFVCRKKTH